MTWLELVFKTDKKDTDALEASLTAAGAEAVTLQDGANEPIFETLPGDTPLWQETEVIGLFPEKSDLTHILSMITMVLKPAPLPPYRIRHLTDVDWKNKWLDYAKPILIGDQLWVSPVDCLDQITAPNPTILKLAPGLAFGTGSHPTTQMCLEALVTHADCYQNQAVIDYGCGSGILGLAALKLGANHMIGVDISEQALTASAQNSKLNDISAASLTLGLPEQIIIDAPSPLLVANILANPLIGLAPILIPMVAPGGLLILSGLLIEDIPRVLATFADNFSIIREQHCDEWGCLIGQKNIDVV